MAKNSNTLAIMAGTGDLPRLLANHCRATNRPFCVVCLRGTDYPWITDETVIHTRIERLGLLFKTLRLHNCQTIVFAGGATRPRVNPFTCDFTMIWALPRLLSALRGGDDGALRGLLALFETRGFAVSAAQEIMPDLMAQTGCPTIAQPTAQDKKDAVTAATISHHMGRADIGQSCVVANGLCLGVESVQGTDALLDFVTGSDPALRFERAKGLLYKGIKRGQDRRIDVPTIGVETIKRAAKAGLGGVVIESNASYIVDYRGTLECADKLGLFLWVREDSGEGEGSGL